MPAPTATAYRLNIDFTKNQILVRDGKGQKDRITTLPASVKEPLLAHLRDVYGLHRKDLRDGFGRVVLPYALARKYRQRGYVMGLAVGLSRSDSIL